MQPSKDWETLPAYDQKLFLKHGTSALARRGKAYVSSRRALSLDWLLTGTLGLLGIFVFDWSSGEAALLLAASFWLGWLADLLLWFARSKALAISYGNAVDDMRFWQIVAILRGKRRIPADARSHPTLGLSLIVDLVSGATATVLLLSGLANSGVATSELTRSGSLLASIASIALIGTAPSLRARLQRAADGSVELPAFCAGQRGIGLLIVVFALMGLGGGRLSAHLIVGTVSGFFVIMSLVELIWGVPELIRETEWVSENSNLSKVNVDCPP
ncbi:MAG: hypothetical protein ABIO49_10780 [Dokdonella sp.]